MPARSNDFQKLIHLIYTQLEPKASVRESALVPARGTGIKREVDVLLETKVADSTYRLAVECRDRSRASDIEWVDCLIGKYRDLPIDKVIAVSKSNFTEAARTEALANRIELRTLVAAMGTDWPAELQRLGIGQLTLNIRIEGARVETDPPWPDTGASSITSSSGSVVPYASFVEHVQEGTSQMVSEDFFKRVAAAGKPLSEVAKPYSVWVEVEKDDVAFITASDDQPYRVLKLMFRVNVTPSFTEAPVTRSLYGQVGVSSAVINAGSESFRVSAVQVPGQDKVTAQITKLAAPPSKGPKPKRP